MNEPSEGGASDRQRSLDQYRKVVAGYDRHMWFARRARQEAVGRLLLRPGHTVVDVGCGTGLSFGLIEAQIGAGGRLIGIEPSPEMLAAARQRVAEHGWNNVALLEATAERGASRENRGRRGSLLLRRAALASRARTGLLRSARGCPPRCRGRKVGATLGAPGQCLRAIAGAPVCDHLRRLRAALDPARVVRARSRGEDKPSLPRS